MAACLLLVPALHIRFPSDRLPIRNLGCFKNYVNPVALSQLGYGHFHVQLPRTRKEKLFGLGIAGVLDGSIFFRNARKGVAYLVFISAALGFDGESDRWFRDFDTLENDRVCRVAESISGCGLSSFVTAKKSPACTSPTGIIVFPSGICSGPSFSLFPLV